MSESRDVSLAVATPADAPLLANLLELYLHDLSEAFPIEVGADGRFGYEFLPLYWTEAGRRFPFLIRCGPRVAGFALLVSLWTGVFFGPRVRTVRSRAMALKCHGKPSGVNGTSKLR